jgi:hypothetical protein
MVARVAATVRDLSCAGAWASLTQPAAVWPAAAPEPAGSDTSADTDQPGLSVRVSLTMTACSVPVDVVPGHHHALSLIGALVGEITRVRRST